MNVFFGSCAKRLLLSPVLGAALIGVAAGPAQADPAEGRVLLKGETTASYFWDDGSGLAGDTGLPAIGKPMQKGMFASPSWPLGTEGYVTYKGKKAKFFIGDRGPGEPSNRGIMLDIDAKTFAELTGGKFNSRTHLVTDNGGVGHIKVEYVITKWGDGPGKKNHPVPFATGAWNRIDRNPAKPPSVKAGSDKTEEAEKKAAEAKKAEEAEKKAAEAKKAETAAISRPAKQTDADIEPAAARTSADDAGSGPAAAVVLAGLAVLGGAAYIGGRRVRVTTRDR